MFHTTRAVASAAHAAVGPVALARADTPGMKRPADTDGTLLSISEECVGRRAVLSVDGEVDLSNATDLCVALESAASRAFEIWLDLSAVTFMDSSGLHAMVEARSRVAEANTRLALICPEGPIRRVLALTGFDRIFEIHASRSAANRAKLA